MLRKLLHFGSNKKSIPLFSPPGYRPTRIYVHQERPFSEYKIWTYIRDFTVSALEKSRSNVYTEGGQAINVLSNQWTDFFAPIEFFP